MHERDIPTCNDYDSRFRRVVAKTGTIIFAIGAYTQSQELNEQQQLMSKGTMTLGVLAVALPIVREWQETRAALKIYQRDIDDEDDDDPDDGGGDPPPEAPNDPGGLAVDWDKEAELLLIDEGAVGVE